MKLDEIDYITRKVDGKINKGKVVDYDELRRRYVEEYCGPVFEPDETSRYHSPVHNWQRLPLMLSKLLEAWPNGLRGGPEVIFSRSLQMDGLQPF